MASRQDPTYTPAQYLAMERAAETKHEYFNGRIYAMSGAQRSHVRVATNVVILLGTQLRGRPCEVFNSDMRIRVSATGLYTYPDVSALCGEPEFEDEEVDVLLNPTVLVEVLSKSTEAYDRGRKFDHYRSIPMLREYVLFEQDQARVEHYVRDGASGDRWGLTVVRGLDATLELPAVGCTLPLRDVYDRVELLADPPLRALYEPEELAGYRALRAPV